ncbi:MAG: N-acetyltransferase [Victivallales bacterium]|nr:N-acetyltransferase [Victivallales bacterium]MCF7889242.1 N-acetyltransferase [Victivallales bacterium]
MKIRRETAADIEAITKVTIEAFKNHPISDQTEHFIIRELREAYALTISLVAEIDGRVIGHIAFSPVSISDKSSGWYGVGPVSVLPAYHKQGIGKTLIEEGIDILKQKGGKGCVLVGDPNYYKKFGFKNCPEIVLEGIPQEVFLSLPFTKQIPKGTVTFHEGFNAKS